MLFFAPQILDISIMVAYDWRILDRVKYDWRILRRVEYDSTNFTL